MDSSPLLLFSIMFLSFPLISFCQKPHALVSPVTKDPSTLQYITKVYQRTPLVSLNLVMDLGGRYLWVDCEKGYVSSTYRHVRCGSAECSLANSYGCDNSCFSKPGPGCNNNTCGVFPENSFDHNSYGRELATDVFSLPSTDGYKPGPAATDPHFTFSCGPTALLQGLAHGTVGIIGLGRIKISPLEQLAATFSFQRTFAICLSNSIGFMFFGGGPYVFLPGIDVSKSLVYTPLLVNPVSPATVSLKGEKSTEYFISVRTIKINEKPVKLNPSLLTINKKGFGGTKISTVNPYTLLESSIYKAVLSAFATALSKVKRVAPVAPFGLCFDTKSIGSTRVGPGVPAIDLVLQSESVYWRIFGANSMVAVSDKVLCLGFVNAGTFTNPMIPIAGSDQMASIIIGGHQLEDNFLVFDQAKSRLGFSSSLLFRQTTCSNFNYTT
ncbi:basic 7S globulin-like protein [Carex littledalei]|uniref:Basic 7S globulin-like protein n=1 Tax=Carex littledalei TaxID=544730 RepID=A0A833R0V4_9POAL|nr:basic 7S globulin-like protein [Carex littledalei]